jgi:potassium uptake TrkH family protein
VRVGDLFRSLRNPAQLTVAAFAIVILIGALLLRLPVAVEGEHPGFSDALFMSTSATTVTGLTSVDIAVFSLFGEVVMLALMQIGGFGIMTIGSVFALLLSKRIGLRQRMRAQTEIGAVGHGELRSLIGAIVRITLLVEGAIAAVLFLRLWLSGAEDAGRAAYSAVFHSVASFNNAGLALASDNLTPYASDPVFLLAITAGIIIGGLGFPVMVELRRRRRRTWSLHARLTLMTTVALLVVGPFVIGVFEWTNPDTLGPLGTEDKIMNAWLQGVSPRTAGFNSVDIGAMNPPTLLVIIGLMFIGGGPASTAGGIKVTTFAMLGYVLWSEVRGDTEVNLFRRRIPSPVILQAIALVLLAIGTIIACTLGLLAVYDVDIGPALFEATSAFGTVGLTTGITPLLPTIGQLMLIVLMLIGRVGPVTFATALALRARPRLYHYPEERPIIG